MGYRDKYELDEAVDAVMHCIKTDFPDSNSEKLVKESVLQISTYKDNLADRSFYEDLIKRLCWENLFVPFDVAETVAAQGFDFLCEDYDIMHLTVTGQDIVDNLPDEAYNDLMRRIRNNPKGSFKLHELAGFEDTSRFVDEVLAKDRDDLENDILGWASFPADDYDENAISYHNFKINFALEIRWNIDRDYNVVFDVEANAFAVKKEDGSFDYLNVTIDGDVYHGKTLDEAIVNFVQSEGLYDSYEAVSRGIIDDGERESYDEDPFGYIRQSFNLYKETLPVKQFEGWREFCVWDAIPDHY